MKKTLLTILCITALVTTSACIKPKAQEPNNIGMSQVFNKNLDQQKMKELAQKMIANQQQIYDRLNLTPEQRELAEKKRAESRKKMDPVIKSMKAKREELLAAKTSNASPAEIQSRTEAIQKEQQKLREEFKKINEENMKDLEKILTPKQKAELKKIQEENKANTEKFKEELKKEILKKTAAGANKKF